jgi:hypothetical protein
VIGGFVHEDELKGQTERMADFYGLRFVFEKTHWVLYDEFVIQTEEFYDFFFVAYVYLRKKRCRVKRVRGTKKRDKYLCGENLRVLRKFSSLPEKRRSWPADVPLKKPKRGVNE